MGIDGFLLLVCAVVVGNVLYKVLAWVLGLARWEPEERHVKYKRRW